MTRDEIIQWIIDNDEGGLVTATGDPGGTTFKGISQRFLDSVRGTLPLLPAGVADLSDSQISALYVTYFWMPLKGDQLPPGLALFLMDTAVNEGPPTAVMMLQQAVGVTVDAVLGPSTLRVVQAMGVKVLPELMARRCLKYADENARMGKFELGWMRRAVRVYSVAFGDPSF